LKKQRKFLLGGLIVSVLVGYLVTTGMADSMVYFFTPTELLAKVAADPSVHEQGVKVGGHVIPGSVDWDPKTLILRFEVVDIEEGNTRFPVTYQGPLPDTFAEDRDVVLEGKYTAEGVFVATNVITKCGSRYEAGAEEYLS
jgi:cytochrome c-type biogenesis protein CcmE